MTSMNRLSTGEFLFDPPRPGAGDYHAHIFHARLSATANPRYVPDYDASVDEYIDMLGRHGLDWGTLVQPSFLGVDNSLLLETLSFDPGRLRGVAVVDDSDPFMTCTDLDEWHRIGIRGVRLNLIGVNAPDLNTERWVEFLSRMRSLGWHLEIQAKAERLAELEHVIEGLPCRVVIDHLGLPDDPDLDVHPLSRLVGLDHLWVKASGRYRSPKGFADAFLRQLLDRGFTRLVFGSDWPHTRFENAAAGAWEWAKRPELQPTT